MIYTANDIAVIIAPYTKLVKSDAVIQQLLTDSRQLLQPDTTLFFALKGEGRTGASFISELYAQGVRNFVVADDTELESIEEANVFRVSDVLAALQMLVAAHRRHFSYPVIGITGSNGKTVVKEWLYHLLQENFAIVRSPKSYNSQIGVPLSVWQMNDEHSLGIFEAGISAKKEMEKLQHIIQPTVGVFTNLGEAHDAGFSSREEKGKEKAKLFSEAQVIIAPYHLNHFFSHQKLFTWGTQEDATLKIVDTVASRRDTKLVLKHGVKTFDVTIPFVDDASIQNAITCCCVLLQLQQKPEDFSPRFQKLHSVDMRLQLKHAWNECLVVNDSYSADITSLKIALNFLQQQSSGLRRTVILSDFAETNKGLEKLYTDVGQLLLTYKISKVIAIGYDISKHLPSAYLQPVEIETYPSTEDFIHDFKSSAFHKEIILIKGARKAQFERIVSLFETRLHQTVLEINLNALAHNIRQYKKLLKPSTKIMAMVKAFAYGSGAAEIAGVLQAQQVHFLAVAYADEGVELVKAGIRLPIMVMNAEPHSFASIVDYNLQPALYSFPLLNQFEKYLEEQGLHNYPVHLEVETGMNRLGFALPEIGALGKHLAGNKTVHVQSFYTHLAASEDPSQDDFTRHQAHSFQAAADVLTGYLPYSFIRHIANSAAIVRHPDLQMDMVRLGIGMYGIEVDNEVVLSLQTVASLRSTIAQIKKVNKGESVSYNRRGVVQRDSMIATVRIGYADGYSRRFGNSVGKMLVRGQLAPVIGTVCMDMTMIDVTDIGGVQEGDEVVIFGTYPSMEQVAGWVNTIPYELMTGISQRVKRVYYNE